MDSLELSPGLYLVATPLGHLQDLSPRAREVLSRASHWAAESRPAAQRWREILSNIFQMDVAAKIVSYRESSRDKDARQILDLLDKGATVALISDAGTPAISDPGWHLVDEVRQRGLPVHGVPGPCAAVLALSISGFPCRRFSFEGFLPASGRHRRETLSRLQEEEAPVIFYESPHRMLDTLEEISVLFPGRDLFVGRELTKKFEECWRGPVHQSHAVWSERRIQGEFTLGVRSTSRRRGGTPGDSAADFGTSQVPTDAHQDNRRGFTPLLSASFQERTVRRQSRSQAQGPRGDSDHRRDT